MLLELAKDRRDEVAIDEGDRTRTFGELADRVTRLAHFLRQDVGLGPREHYSLLMGNCLEAAELILGGIASSQWVNTSDLGPCLAVFTCRCFPAR